MSYVTLQPVPARQALRQGLGHKSTVHEAIPGRTLGSSVSIQIALNFLNHKQIHQRLHRSALQPLRFTEESQDLLLLLFG